MFDKFKRRSYQLEYIDTGNYTAAEYEDLFKRAGLRLTRIVPTKSPYSVIEAVAA